MRSILAVIAITRFDRRFRSCDSSNTGFAIDYHDISSGVPRTGTEYLRPAARLAAPGTVFPAFAKPDFMQYSSAGNVCVTLLTLYFGPKSRSKKRLILTRR